MTTMTCMIVLSRQPYRETALLLGGFSPDFGRLNLVAHGAQSAKNGTPPAADLYRELEVEFEEKGEGDLFTARSLELLTPFDALAEQPRHFLFAGKIGAFLLKNSLPGVAMPFTYDSLRSCLGHLALPPGHSDRTLEQLAVIVKLTYLYECGLLPEAATAEQGDFLENLVASGVEDSPLPDCPPTYWNALNLWLNSLIDFHHLKR